MRLCTCWGWITRGSALPDERDGLSQRASSVVSAVFSKSCWNRQLDLLQYLERLRTFLAAWRFTEEVQRIDRMRALLARKPWKRKEEKLPGADE